MPGSYLAAAAMLAVSGGLFAPPSALGASPWWHLEAVARSSGLSASKEAEIALSAVNLGDAPAGGPGRPILFVDTLPQGATALEVSGVAGRSRANAEPLECAIQTERSVSCAYEGSLVPYDQIEIRIGVALAPGDNWPPAENELAVTGGGAPPKTLESKLPVAEAGSLGIEKFEVRPEEEEGAVGTQAGSHPFQVTLAFSLTQNADAMPTALPKDVRFRLPPGLLADTNAVSACPLVRFHEGTCPLASVAGAGTFAVNEESLLGVTRLVAPIFNLEPSPGQPARFGSLPLNVPVIINSSIRPGEYSAELSIGNLTQLAGFLGATVTLWGVPGDARHDDARGHDCLMAARSLEDASCTRLEDPDPRAMLTLPTSCDDPPPHSSIEVSPWVDPLDPVGVSQPFARVTGCGAVPFSPLAEARASSASASSPSGFDLRLNAPGSGLRNPEGIGESSLQRLEVTLPQGVTINPSAANGLSSCRDSDYVSESLLDHGCPDASKVGAVAIESPIFAGALNGSAYLGEEEGERFDGSFDLYLVARNPRRGLLVKLRAQLRLDPRTGRIAVVADDLPQLPLSSLRLSFPPGPRALLATPSRCGASSIETALTPYSNPAAALEVSSPLAVTSGPGGGPCPGEDLPFHPQLEAGTLNNAAARYSPLYVRVSRADGEADLAGLSLALPAGLSARLAGLGTCSSAALAAAATKAAAAEAVAPSCPSGAAIGRTLIGAGVGPLLSEVPGRLYLADPYQGAPFSLAAVIPARLGPLDLGTIVRRFPVNVDPRSGQLRVELGEGELLPSMIDGIALHLRDLRLYLDRPGFILNPSGCEPTTIRGAAHALDGQASPLAERFQAADCARLSFKPSLSLRLTGALGRNGHPGLRATIRSGGREAHLAAFRFTLPPGELLDFHHLRALCGRAVPVRRCPAASQLGHAQLRSPLLDQPLRGPIYLRQPVRGLPDLVADLRSEGIRIVLEGHTAAPSGRLRVSFPSLPDLPLSRGTIVLEGGHRGLLANSESLCRKPQRAEAFLASQSGKSRRYRPPLRLEGSC